MLATLLQILQNLCIPRFLFRMHDILRLEIAYCSFACGSFLFLVSPLMVLRHLYYLNTFMIVETLFTLMFCVPPLNLSHLEGIFELIRKNASVHEANLLLIYSTLCRSLFLCSTILFNSLFLVTLASINSIIILDISIAFII
jgi:hypothetical protein